MTLKVIQWATGMVGQEAIKGVLAHPDLELVGAWVHSPAKAGKDVGELCGVPPIGVTATGDLDEICAMDADCVVYAPLLASTRTVCRLLESGKNVVTPVGWIYPTESPKLALIEDACRRGSSTLHGTGINPGGITERFPLMVSAMCRDIRHVRVEEFSDIRNYPTESMVREVMLFGTPPEQAVHSPMPAIMADGFCQSIDMIAAELGWTLDADKRTTHEMAVATRALETPVGVLDAGTVAAQRFTWQGLVDGRAGDHRARELADGRGGPRSAVDARRSAVRDRARRGAAARGHVPRPAPPGRRREPGDRAHRTGNALCERDPLRVRGGTGDQDVPGPAAHSGSSGSNGIVNAGASTPPSTSKILPVTQLDASDAR